LGELPSETCDLIGEAVRTIPLLEPFSALAVSVGTKLRCTCFHVEEPGLKSCEGCIGLRAFHRAGYGWFTVRVPSRNAGGVSRNQDQRLAVVRQLLACYPALCRKMQEELHENDGFALGVRARAVPYRGRPREQQPILIVS
jgi:hypothetical protein